MTNLISPEYTQTIKKQHAISKWGADGHKHANDVLFLAEKLGARTILDYGCGRGTLKKKLSEVAPKIKVFEYDPGIDGKESDPLPADLVVCTDVLEHIEPYKIGNVLKHIRSLSNSGAYLVISCRAANTILPDGRNAHLIIKSPEWWMKSINRHFSKVEYSGGRKELKAVYSE